MSTNDLEERIRERAHEIWEREGRPEGAGERHWEQARAELAAEHAGSDAFDALQSRADLESPDAPADEGVQDGGAMTEVAREISREGGDGGQRPHAKATAS